MYRSDYVELEDCDADAAGCTGACKSNEMSTANVTGEQ